MENQPLTDAPAPLLAHLAFRRLSARVRTSVGYFFPENEELPLPVLRKAARHAWLALEITLAGPGVWDQLAAALPATHVTIFRQQLESLSDLLNLAGLGCDHPRTRARFVEEFRTARQENFLAQAKGLDLPRSADNLSGPEEAERHALDRFARACKQAGFPHLARLVALRSLADEPLLLGAVEIFLHRTLVNAPELGWDLPDLPDYHSGICCRSLELLAVLLAEREEYLVSILDRPDQLPEPAEADAQADDAIAQELRKGLKRFQLGEYRQAAEHFTAALKLNPTDADLYAHRGDAFRLQCEYERALADYQLALHLSPNDPAILVNRALAYHLSGDCDRAVADCSAALEDSPNNPAALRTRAAAYADLGTHDLALIDISKAIAQTPDDDAAIYQRGIIHGERGDFAQAVTDFNRVLELNPHHVLAYLQRGQAHLQRSDFPSAIRDFTEVLRRHPNNMLAFCHRGKAHQFKGDTDRAIADYTEALRLDPKNAQIFCRRGILHRIKGDLGRALADLDEAIRRETASASAFYHRAKIALAQGQFHHALIDLNEAIHLQPKFGLAFLSRSLVQARLGQFQDAVADASRALELDARSSAVFLVRGVVHTQLGEYAAAVADLTQALALDRGLTLAFHERAMAYTLRGENERALADCNDLLALDPRNAPAYLLRSSIHHALGNLQPALVDYARALQLDSHSVVTGSNQRLTEAAYNQTTRQIADYIDGLRPTPRPAESAPPADVNIVVGSPDAVAVSPPLPEPPASAAPQRIRFAPESAQPPPAPIQKAAAPTPPKKSNPTAAVLEPTVETVAEAPALPKKPAAKIPPKKTGDQSKPRPSAKAQPPAKKVESRKPVPKPVEDEAIEFEPVEVEEPTFEEEEWEPNANAHKELKDFTKALAEKTSEPARPPVVYTPPPVPAPAPPTIRRRAPVEDDDPGFLAKMKKPLPLALSSLAALVILFVGYRLLRGEASDHVPLQPALGKAEFEGKPLANAAIYLDPAWTKEPKFPRPRAVVKSDGFFALETYGKEDGAPVGDYRVTVQCFQRPDKNAGDGGPPPRNLLPARYANFDTSGLTLKIQKGDNQLPAIKLKR